MTQDGKERMSGRWWGKLGRLDIRDAGDQNFMKVILSCFGDPVSEFPLTYHCEFIDEEFGLGMKEIDLDIPLNTPPRHRNWANP